MAETRRIVSKVVIQGSLEAVWREITKTDEVSKAFFNARLHGQMEPGGKIAVRTPDGKYTIVVGEILEYDPPRRFAHTFQFTSYDDPPCKVIYELKELPGGGVELTLTSDEVVAGSKTDKSMSRGGDFIVNNVKRIVEKGNVSLGVRMVYGMFGLLQWTTPKRCKTENWQ